jgi:hypothetical protein
LILPIPVRLIIQPSGAKSAGRLFFSPQAWYDQKELLFDIDKPISILI